MSRASVAREGLTLDEFLDLPEIDVHPYMEYIDGRVVAKVSPQKKHSALTSFFLERLNRLAIPGGLGEAYPELRCTYAGRSIVPDVVFLLEEHIEVDDEGYPIDETRIPPDLHIEIISPKQGVTEADEKLWHSTAHGCPLGWLVHPYRRTIAEYRPGREPRILKAGDMLEGEPFLPGFRLPVDEVFGWLGRRRPGRDRGGPA